jgi:hypothetical protein
MRQKERTVFRSSLIEARKFINLTPCLPLSLFKERGTKGEWSKEFLEARCSKLEIIKQ